MGARAFKDRDFVETVDGLIFCVVGYRHPPDRVLAYLKYVPSKKGRWGTNELRYFRTMKAYTIPELAKNIEWLKKNYPRYVYYSKVLGIELSAVPLDAIKKHFRPEERLQELLSASSRDELEDEAIGLVELLSKRSGVPLEYFGITGSVLLSIHNPKFSDIDITVYGRESSLKVKDVLLRMYQEPDSEVRRLRGERLKRWCEEKAMAYPVSKEEAKEFYRRRWNYATYKGRPFSVHPTKSDDEVTESYGDEVYEPLAIVELEAKVDKVVEDLYLPHVYLIKDVSMKKGTAKGVKELVTQEGFYGSIEEDERIVVRGKLEKVTKASGEAYHRVFVGSPEAKGLDFIKPRLS